MAGLGAVAILSQVLDAIEDALAVLEPNGSVQVANFDSIHFSINAILGEHGTA